MPTLAAVVSHSGAQVADIAEADTAIMALARIAFLNIIFSFKFHEISNLQYQGCKLS
jgi:hypothetical protein